MEIDISWYVEGQNNFRNEPSTSGTHHSRPPDTEPREQKPNTSDLIDEVYLIDDGDDAEEAVNAFHDMTRKKILLPFIGVEIQEELKFLEAIKQFKLILEEKVEVLTLSKNLKKVLYKCLLFFSSNYGRIAILYKEQYLDVMEDILLFYCGVVREYFIDQKMRKKKLNVVQEGRRIKILFRNCLLNKMDRIFHVLLKLKLTPEISGCKMLWGEVYIYFLTKVRCTQTDDDILRRFIVFQKFKTIREQSEWTLIDKLMYSGFSISRDKLRKIPCLGEIMDKMRRDRLYTVRDMVTTYMRHYKEKVSQTRCFEMDGLDEDTEESNVNEGRRLDLSNSFRSTCATDSPTTRLFADRRRGVRKTILDLASEPDHQLDQHSDLMLFDDDDVTKKEAPDDLVVVLDDDEDDDVIVVCDNLKNVITIDDDDDDDEPVHIQPTKSPPPRDAISPNKILQLPEFYQSTNNTSQPIVEHPSSLAEQTRDISPSQNVPPTLMEVENVLTPQSPKNIENSVQTDSILPPKESSASNTASVPGEKLDILLSKKMQIYGTQKSTRLVKKVDNSLKITINSSSAIVPDPCGSNKNVPSVEVNKDCEGTLTTPQILPEKCLTLPAESMEIGETFPLLKEVVVETVTSAASFDKEAAGSLQDKQNLIPVQSKTPSVHDTDLPNETRQESQVNQPKEGQEVGLAQIEVSDQSTLQNALSSERSFVSKEGSEPSSENQILDEVDNIKSMMELGFSSSNNTSERLDSFVKSTNYKEIVPLINVSAISPIVEKRMSCIIDRVENSSDTTTIELSVSKRIGVLPSSKIPSDLEDSPEKNSEICRRRYNESETSNISSPSFESIDKSEVQKHFESEAPSLNNKLKVCTSMSSSTKTLSPMSQADMHTAAAESSMNTSLTESIDSDSIWSSETSHCESDTSSCDKSDRAAQETAIIPVEHACKSNDKPREELIKPSGNQPIQVEKTLLCESSLTPETIETAAARIESCDTTQKILRNLDKPRNYSNITECFTKFTDELSSEDIFSTHCEDLAAPTENLALTTINLVPSTENLNDVIMIKCQPIQPLKDEENIVSRSETIAFSADEVLAPSNEAIALLVTYPATSQEESQPILIDANLAVSDEHVTYSNNQMDPVSNVLSPLESQHSDKASADTNKSVSHPRRETLDGLTLSGSQPYTPQSSPSTRIETVRQDNRIDESSGTLDQCLNCPPGGTSHPTLNFSNQESSIIEAKHLHDAQPLENTTKRTEFTEISSFKASKPCRKSSDLSKDLNSELRKNDTKNISTSKPYENPVEGFREDLSQSITSAKKITPQEVDKITHLPFKYSQELWNNGSQQLAERSQNNPFKKQGEREIPLPAKSPHQRLIIASSQKPSAVQCSISPPDINVSQQIVVTKSASNLLCSSDKQMNNRTCSASFVEEKLNELYLKEYGNDLSQPDNRLSQPIIQSKRTDSVEAPSVRPVKIYAKEKPTKDLSQPKDRDMSLKSYKTLIKGVSKRRSSVLRDIESPLQTEEGVSQLHSRKEKRVTEDTFQQKDFSDFNKGPFPREANICAHNELFSLEGDVGKPIGGTDDDNNFLAIWGDSDTCNTNSEDTYSGTISVKSDSQLYQAKKGTVNLQKNLVPGVKSSRSKVDTGSPEEKSPEKKKAAVVHKGLYVENETVSLQEQQPNYFDYSFNSFFASQNSLSAPLQQNLVSPELSASYYPNVNFSNQSSVYLNKLQSQNNLFLPSDNLEIDPNLLHSEKNISEIFNTEQFETSARRLKDVEQDYGFEHAEEEVPFLSLSNALIGGSMYTSSHQDSVMFKDNPFIGQDLDNAISANPKQSERYLYPVQLPDSALSQAKSPPVPKASALTALQSVDIACQPKITENLPEHFPHSDSALNLQSNLFHEQNSLRLPAISTLKDPRRRNNKNFAHGHDLGGSKISQTENSVNFMPNIDMMHPSSTNIVQSKGLELPVVNNPVLHNPDLSLQSFDSVSVHNKPVYKRSVEKYPKITTPNQLPPSEIIPDSVSTPKTAQLPPETYDDSNKALQTPKLEESNTTETLQESLQKTLLPPKKRKLTEDEELAIYIQKFKEEKERKKKLEENISYPAQRQMSIADLQRDFPKVKTLAARKLYPNQNYYEYPQGYDQYGDFNDYGNKRSIMNVYINGVRECSANYPLCLMIGTVHTCVNNQPSNAPESENAAQPRPPSEVPQYAELTIPAQNIQKTVTSDVVPRQVLEVPQARPKRSRKAGAGACAGEAPPAKRGRGRPRKNVN